jgi:uncharacterized paraquat-inducible protein A
LSIDHRLGPDPFWAKLRAAIVAVTVANLLVVAASIVLNYQTRQLIHDGLARSYAHGMRDGAAICFKVKRS